MPLEPAPRQSDRVHDRRLVQIVLAVLAILGGISTARILTLFERYSQYDGVLRVFFVALALSTVLSAITVAILRQLDRRDPLPDQLYAGLLFWGAVLSTGLALPINQRVLREVDALVKRNNWIPYAGENRGFLLGAPIAGPLVEETLKGAGVLLVYIFFRSLFRSPRDGFIMGALVGVGFNWFESALYVANDYAKWGVHTYGLELGARYALFGFAMHPVFTGLIGLGLGYAACSESRTRAVLWGVAGYLLALIAHLVNNGLGIAVVVILHYLEQPIPELNAPPRPTPFLSAWIANSVKSLIIFLPSLVLVGLTLWRTGTWERSTIRMQLADEASDVVTSKERVQIEKERRFRPRRYRWEPRSSGKRVIREQNKLAFAKYQAQKEGSNPDLDPEVIQSRDRVRALRAATS